MRKSSRPLHQRPLWFQAAAVLWPPLQLDAPPEKRLWYEALTGLAEVLYMLLWYGLPVWVAIKLLLWVVDVLVGLIAGL